VRVFFVVDEYVVWSYLLFCCVCNDRVPPE